MNSGDYLAAPGLDWESIFQEILVFADQQIKRLRWRHQIGGVLPAGFDANSLAAQAILDFLQQSARFGDAPDSLASGKTTRVRANFPTTDRPSPGPHPLASGDRERVRASVPTTNLSIQCPNLLSSGERTQVRASLPPTNPILWQIKRHVLRQVTRLHHLKENWLVSSEADLALVGDQDGEPINPILLIPNPETPPDEALIEKESYLQFYDLKSRFEVFLAKERQLKTLFELRCDGLCKPQALASHLKVGVRHIENLQKRLQRRWLKFHHIITP